jgi:hypothetical protein
MEKGKGEVVSFSLRLTRRGVVWGKPQVHTIAKNKPKPDEPFFNYATLPIFAALSLGKGARNKSSRPAYPERRWSVPLSPNCHQW